MNDEKAEKDRMRIAAWVEARKITPGDDELHHLAHTMQEAHERAAEAEAEYRRAIVRRACVYGWSKAAQEAGVSPKMVHTWRATYLPDAEDLSSVLTVEIPRENRRVERAKERAEAEANRAARAAEVHRRMAERQAQITGATDAEHSPENTHEENR